jgi:hypothetical protein
MRKESATTPRERDTFHKFIPFPSQDFLSEIWYRADEMLLSCNNHTERFHVVASQHFHVDRVVFTWLVIIHDTMIQKTEGLDMDTSAKSI